MMGVRSVVGLVALAFGLGGCAVATEQEVPETENVETSEQGLEPKICPAIAILCIEGYKPKQLPNCRQICVPDNGTSEEQGECAVGGCSGELCHDPALGGGISICIYKPEYACYDTATCERQADGSCGWTQTPELMQCLADNSSTLEAL